MTIRTTFVIPFTMTMAVVTAAAAQEATCQWTLKWEDVMASFEGEVPAQPVFAVDGVKGFRLYGTEKSAPLSAQGITPGALLTHVCGVPAKDVQASPQKICCTVDPTQEIELTFRIGEQSRAVRIRAPRASS